MKKELCALGLSSLLIAGGMFPSAAKASAISAADIEEKPCSVGFLLIPGNSRVDIFQKVRETEFPSAVIKGSTGKKTRPDFEKTEPEPEVIFETDLTDEEIDLVARMTMAEAEDQSELGMRLVIDTILNRRDSEKFPNTIEGVLFQRGQFSPVANGRWNRCYVRDDIRELVVEECQGPRANYEVLYFQMGQNCSYGTFLFKEDGHYFFK